MATNAVMAQQAIAPDIERILKRRVLRVAMYEQDVDPFFMTDEYGRLYGFDIELARDIGRNLGVDIEFVRDARTYDEVVTMVLLRKADVGISYMSQTVGRGVKVKFTVPYLNVYYALLINRFKNPETQRGLGWNVRLDNPGKVIGVLKGSSYVEFGRRDYPSVQLIQYPRWEQATQDIVDGTIHAVYFDAIYIMDWAANNTDQMLYVQPKILRNKQDTIAIAVHWEDTQLLSWLNLYLSRVNRDGMLQQLKDYYLQADTYKK